MICLQIIYQASSRYLTVTSYSLQSNIIYSTLFSLLSHIFILSCMILLEVLLFAKISTHHPLLSFVFFFFLQNSNFPFPVSFALFHLFPLSLFIPSLLPLSTYSFSLSIYLPIYLSILTCLCLFPPFLSLLYKYLTYLPFSLLILRSSTPVPIWRIWVCHKLSPRTMQSPFLYAEPEQYLKAQTILKWIYMYINLQILQNRVFI